MSVKLYGAYWWKNEISIDTDDFKEQKTRYIIDNCMSKAGFGYRKIVEKAALGQMQLGGYCVGLTKEQAVQGIINSMQLEKEALENKIRNCLAKAETAKKFLEQEAAQ